MADVSLFKTQSQVLAEMLASLQAAISDAYVGEDGLWNILLSIPAGQLENAFLANQLVLNDMFVATASRQALIQHGADYGVAFKDGTRSAGQLLFSGEGNTYIGIDTEVAYDPGGGLDPVYFQVTEDGTIPDPGIPDAPTVQINAIAGNLTGLYEYVVTFVTEQGETLPSAPSAAVNPNTEQVALSNVPLGGPGTIARRIYRDKNGAGDYRLVDEIPDNSTNTYTDNIHDAEVAVANQVPTVDTAHTLLLDAMAAEAGVDGNVVAGAITSLVNAPAALTGVTNPLPFSGGSDAEDTEAFRIRLLNYIRSPETGSLSDIKAWAESIDGVGSASVFNNDNLGVAQNGHVTVRIAAPDGTIPDSSVVAAVQSYITSKDIATITPHTTTFIPVAVDAEIDLAIDPNFSLDDIQSSVEGAVTNYINTLGVGETLYLSGIVAAVKPLVGVDDVRVISPTTNRTITSTQKWQAGTVTVTGGGVSPPVTPGHPSILPSNISASSLVTGQASIQGKKTFSGTIAARGTVAGSISRSGTQAAAHVQAAMLAPASGTPATSTPQVAMPANVQAGNYMVVALFRWGVTTVESATMADSLGNTYTRAPNSVVDTLNGDNVSLDIFTAPVSTAGACTITATLGTARAAAIIAHEISGGGVDKISIATSGTSGTAPNTVSGGSVTTTQSNDLVIGFVCNGHSSQSFQPGTGFTLRQASPWNQAGDWIASEDKNQLVAGAVAATWSETTFGNQDYVAATVAILPGVGSGGGGGGGDGDFSGNASGTFRWGGSYDVTQVSNYRQLAVMATDLNAPSMPGDMLASTRKHFYRSAISVNSGWDTSIPWSTANANGWLLRDSNGNLLINRGYPNNNVIDVSNDSATQAIANNTITWLSQHGFTGAWFDDVVKNLEYFTGMGLPAGWTEQYYYTQLVRHVRRLSFILKNAGYKAYFNANGYTPGDPQSNDATSTYNFWQDIAAPASGNQAPPSGLTNEYWMQYSDTNGILQKRLAGTAWYQNWDSFRSLHTLANSMNFDFNGLSYGAADSALTIWAKATFLLDWNGKGSFLHSGTDSANPYGPSWCKAMGTALGAAVLSGGTWTRQFANGSVSVNPTTGVASIN